MKSTKIKMSPHRVIASNTQVFQASPRYQTIFVEGKSTKDQVAGAIQTVFRVPHMFVLTQVFRLL